MGHVDVNLANGSKLGDYLYDSSYDIIYVDNNDGTDDIKRNAALLADVIKWVNTQKQTNGSSEPNVVMGISMGGLVARIALCQLEKQGYNHQTRLFISMDSPYNGANIPVGIQAAVLHANTLHFWIGIPGHKVEIKLADYVEDISKGVKLLNSMAASQMLFYKVVPSGNGYKFQKKNIL